MSDKDENSGKHALIFSVVITVVLMGAGFLWAHFRSPDGAHDAWLHGELLVVEEYREDEDGADTRIAVHELNTGKRVADRDPGSLDPFDFVNGRLWLHDRHEPYRLEAWGVPALETELSAELKLADSNVCSDGAHARVKGTDGRYTLISLSDGKTSADVPELKCGTSPSSWSSSGASSRGYLSAQREASSERQTLLADKTPLAGGETFLEPQYLFSREGPALELEGDVFVVHRVELGNNRAMKLSRVSEGKVQWTVPLGDPNGIERALLAAGKLVVVGHKGVTVLDAKTGTALWRTGG